MWPNFDSREGGTYPQAPPLIRPAFKTGEGLGIPHSIPTKYGTELRGSSNTSRSHRIAFAQLRNIGLIRQYLTSYATKSLINGLVTSRLDYCNALLYGVPQTLMHKLQRVQNCAARIVTRRSRFDHISPVLKDLHWLPVHRRVQFKTLLYTYEAIHKQAPGYLSDMVSVRVPTRALRSASTIVLAVPSRTETKTKFRERHFKYSSSTLWNDLPIEIRNAPSLAIFKTLLNRHLFLHSF